MCICICICNWASAIDNASWRALLIRFVFVFVFVIVIVFVVVFVVIFVVVFVFVFVIGLCQPTILSGEHC